MKDRIKGKPSYLELNSQRRHKKSGERKQILGSGGYRVFQIGHPKCPKARGSSVRPSPWVPKLKCPQTKLPCCVVCLSWGKHGGWGVGGARCKGAVLPTEGRPWLRSRLVLLPPVAPEKRWLCWQEAWTTPPTPPPP